MPDVILAGSSISYTAGAIVVGRAPAMVSGGAVTSLPLHNLIKYVLPADPQLSSVAIYRATYVAGDSAATFPGGSPLVYNGTANHFKDQSATALTTAYSYWAVTFDKYGNPATPTSANAAYLGHS